MLLLICTVFMPEPDALASNFFSAMSNSSASVLLFITSSLNISLLAQLVVVKAMMLISAIATSSSIRVNAFMIRF